MRGDCDTCKYKNHSIEDQPCCDCESSDDKPWSNWKPQTNGDKIRAMTDEEIVEQVAQIAAWKRNCNKRGLLKWLKQEATDD